jgi:cytochrome c5
MRRYAVIAALSLVSGLASFAAADTGSLATGKMVWMQTCVACHGADGRGVIPGTPDLTERDGPLAKSDAVLLAHITDGFQTPGAPLAMPPKGGNPTLGDADLTDVLAYMRATFGR